MKEFGHLNRSFRFDEGLSTHRKDDDHGTTSTQQTYTRSPTSADSGTEMQRASDAEKENVEASSAASIRCSCDSDVVFVETEAVIECREYLTEEIQVTTSEKRDVDVVIEPEVELQTKSVLHFEVENDSNESAESVC